ncbi:MULTISPECIES: murein transglycosylase A [unclassified Massilia]|uniref:murein transglycosylase A n=1 Tax=unclassified Massilia TaxID=2609279 RepID=UPI0017873BB3|nr:MULTISPECIES: MltA domain-containing protein [unclassified Massilia]MBD8529523.1 MltA domain-containing protein [Massilia sp. CFBP 13647]MBD8673390.1 MltA domain-containing protein [Massilia sp. CFBP 13721]
MQTIRRSVPASLSVVALLLAACGTPPPAPPARPQPAPSQRPDIVMPPPVGPVGIPADAPQPPPVAASVPPLTPVSFDTLPGWQQDDLRQAWPAYLASCRVLAKKPQWSAPCAATATVDAGDSGAIRRHFETYFVPQQMRMPDGADTGLITGYYEPMLRGARKRGGAFQTPLYRVPDDLITVDLAAAYPTLKNMRLRGRLVGKTVVPYSTRAEIERAPLSGKELVWVDDPVEAFFLEVQGSGRVRIDESGETVRIAFADQNGHPYKVIGRWLVEQGQLPADGVSAQSIKAWIAANPQRRQELLNVNPSYIFFREERLPDPNIGPKGALGVPLTPERSVAVDPTQVPLGAPLFLSTTHPTTSAPIQRLMMAQDTGGAIRGAVRADFFFGFGGNAAEYAGRMKQRGNVWVLLPR